MSRRNQGVTLIELMIVVGIISILTMVAVPAYQNYMRRANRSDATAALLKVGAMQEKYYVQNNTYATTAQLGAFGNTEHGFYTIAITTTSGLTTDFTATATATSGKRQFVDTDCRQFTLTSTGARNALKSDSSANGGTCWR